MTELELYHYGVKGMKWGVRRNRKKKTGKNDYQSIVQKRIAATERRALIKDSKKVATKAAPGKHRAVYGKYSVKDIDGGTKLAIHLVNDLGQVKLSYIKGRDGHRFIAAGKDYISKINLNEFFKTVPPNRIEYDVYD